MQTAMHIYVLSRLYNKPAHSWEQRLRELERGRAFITTWYRPLREACVIELRNPGTGRAHLERGLKKLPSTDQRKTVVQKSRRAFQNFVEVIKPKLGPFKRSLLRGEDKKILWNGFHLTGGFHFEVEPMRTGGPSLIYVHASDWDADQLTAFVEMLAIAAEESFGLDRAAVGLWDLNDCELIRPSRNFVRLRKRLLDHMSHFLRVFPSG